MPTIDEQVELWADGFYIGVSVACGYVEAPMPDWLAENPTRARGFDAGRAAYLAAEQAERERLERCDSPYCELRRGHDGVASGLPEWKGGGK